MRLVNFLIDRSTDARLSRLAKATDRSRSSVLRELVRLADQRPDVSAALRGVESIQPTAEVKHGDQQ